MEKETLFRGRFYSLAREGELWSAMRVGPDGRIRETYPEGASLPPRSYLEASSSLECDIVETGGAACVPAFIDTHTHLLAKAILEATATPLFSYAGGRVSPGDFGELRELLTEGARKQARGLVLGYGLVTMALTEKRLPRKSELDNWLPGRSAVVLSLDGHSSAYTSLALRELKLESLAQDGVLSGKAHDFNMGALTRRILSGLRPGSLARGISACMAEAARSGVATIHTMEGFDDARFDLSPVLLSLLGPALPIRLKLWLQYTKPEKVGVWRGQLSEARAGGCLAWEMDGSVSSRTAAMDRPFAFEASRGTGKVMDARTGAATETLCGTLYRDVDQAEALIRPFYRKGYRCAAHAIGPRAIEALLGAYERLLDGAGDSENRLRLRIEHFEFPRPDQIERAGRRKLVLAVQPGFHWYDERVFGIYPRLLGEETWRSMNPLRSLMQAGCVVSLSTDAPVQGFAPGPQLEGAVLHPVHAERLSVYEALRAYTWAGAWAGGEESWRGTLEKGKFADFAVLDKDPFITPETELHEMTISATWLEGRLVQAPPADLPGFLAQMLKATRKKM